jgi:hypothetical protein
MDDKIRISRSKVGIVDQLRVFVRSDYSEEDMDAAEKQTQKIKRSQNEHKFGSHRKYIFFQRVCSRTQ